MMKKLLLIFCAVFYTHGYTQSIPVTLGNKQVIIEYHAGKAPMYVHLHENETTALAAIKKTIPYRQNAWLSLHHAGTRTIRFDLHHQRFEFDPNRMFTPKGIRLSLAHYSHYSSDAATEINKLAAKIKELIADKPVIAVHNNQGYSLEDYLPGHSLSHDAKRIHFPHKTAYRNFFLVTRFDDYAALKDKSANVIEQHSDAEDDGSLSVYMANKTYVNVEAGYDQLAAQIQMLDTAQKLWGYQGKDPA